VISVVETTYKNVVVTYFEVHDWRTTKKWQYGVSRYCLSAV